MLKVIKQGQLIPEDSFVRIPMGEDVEAVYPGDEEEREKRKTEERTIRNAEEEIELRRAQFDALMERKQAEAEEFAQRVRTQAEQERDSIIEQAKRSSIAMMEEARLEGVDKGFQAKTAEIDAMLQRMNAALASLKRDQEQFFQEYAAHTKDFALEIAAKILHQQITLDPATMETLVVDAIGMVRDADWLTVKLAAGSGELIKLLGDYYHQSDARKIAFTENRSAPGTCIVDTPDGTIDASIQTQLENLKQAFQKAEKG